MPMKILAVDDSKTIRLAIKITFAAEDAEVTAIARGSELVAKAKELQPDVILVDQRLGAGDLSGPETCAAIRADSELASTPIILMMPMREGVSDEKAQAVGANAAIGKPFETQALLDLVRAQKGQGVQRPAVAVAAPKVARPAAGAPATAGSSVSAAAPKATPAPSPGARPSPSVSPPSSSAAASPRPTLHATPAVGASLRLMDRPPAAAGNGAAAAVARPAATSSAAAFSQGAPQGDSSPIPIAIPIPFAPAGSPTPSMLERIQAAVAGQPGANDLSPAALEALARLSHEVVERIAWEIVPELAESILRERSAQHH